MTQRLTAALEWVREPARYLRGGVENVDITAGRVIADALDAEKARADYLDKRIKQATPAMVMIADGTGPNRAWVRDAARAWLADAEKGGAR